MPKPAPNAPIVSTVIPAEGPMAGGTTVAIIGANFTPGLVVLFGDRIAKLQRIDPTFIQCSAPPAAAPGHVEVTISGAVKLPDQVWGSLGRGLGGTVRVQREGEDTRCHVR